MKKITILALHLGYGGIENCISNLANSLVDDYEVNIVSTYKLYEKPVFKLNDKIKIKYLMTDLKPNKQELKQSLKKLKLITFFKELKKSLKVLKLKKNLMIEVIKNCDSDVIISTRDIHNNWLSKYGRDKTLKIGWEHNHHHNNKRYINKVTKSVLGLDYFVLVSKDLTKFYSEKLKDKKVKCVYIPNSINFFPQEKAKLETENLISIGRLSHEKGYLDLIDIFKELHQKYPDSKLNIIGDGPDRKKIEKKIRDNKLEDYIILHGFQEKEYINKYLEKEGYVNTKLYDPSGYDMDAQTTVLDLAKLVKKLLKHQWFRDIVSQSSYTAILPDGSKQTWENTNIFLDSTSEYYNENVLGVKTGSLSDDYNLIVLYKKHGKELLICSLGSQSNTSRYDDVSYILKTIDESDYLKK